MKKADNNQDIISTIKKLQKSFMGGLKKTERNLRGEILRVERRVENIEDRVEGIEERVQQITVIEKKIDKIDKTLDGFVGAVDDLRKDNVVGTHHTRELEVKVEDHEERIIKLESPAA